MKLLTKAALIACTSLVAPPMVAAPAAVKDPQPQYDCALARGLPADVDEDSKRRACTIPLRYQEDVSMAEIVGRAIRLHDAAAWVTSDALVERHVLDNIPKDGVGEGWITQQEDGAVLVKYVARAQERDVAFASARLQLSPWQVKDVQALKPPEPLDASEHELVEARALALRQEGLFVCSPGRPNVAMFRWEENGRREILVFVMSAWSDDAPLGGYHLIRVSEDGTRVLDRFAQTRGCITTPRAELQKTEALMVSHLTSATPTMFHVFMSLQFRKPMFVATTQNGLLWLVDKGRISLMENPGEAESTPSASDAAETEPAR